jgi:hypothetical protein
MGVAFVSEPLTPLEAVDAIAKSQQWEIDRSQEDERVVFVEGISSEYELAFSWLEEEQVLGVECGFDFKMEKAQSKDLQKLIGEINQILSVGHFEWWSEGGGMILLRHSIVKPPQDMISPEEIYTLLAKLLETCEDNFASFMFLNEGKTVADALALNIRETQGSA